MFSRFDNMMQHTQTHNKSRGGNVRRTKPTDKKKPSSSKSSKGKDSDSSESPADYDYDDYPSLPSPPPSRKTSTHDHGGRHQRPIHPTAVVEEDDDGEDALAESDSDASYHPPFEEQRPEFQHTPESRHSGYHREPLSPVDSSSSSSESERRKRRRMTPKVHFHPYPYNYKHHPSAPNVLRPLLHPSPDHTVLPRLASYLVSHPDGPPENYLLHYRRSMSMPDIKAAPAQPTAITRRLSVQDLCNPIEMLGQTRR